MSTSTSKRAKSKKRVKLPEIRQKRGGNPHPNPPPPEHQFKPGQSGNPGGRPKLLGEAYKAKLARVVPGDSEGRTYAEVMADAVSLEVIRGNVQAAKEIRSATEGDRVVFEDAWKSEIVEHLKAGHISPQDVIEAIGLDDARSLIITAGAAIPALASESKDTTGTDADDRPAD